MSHRKGQITLLSMIRKLQEDVRLLKDQSGTTRTNSIRLGNLVIEADPRPPGIPTSLKITNMSTGLITLIAV
jgi:hypothetical protein